jgi:hypothetical protein
LSIKRYLSINSFIVDQTLPVDQFFIVDQMLPVDQFFIVDQMLPVDQVFLVRRTLWRPCRGRPCSFQNRGRRPATGFKSFFAEKMRGLVMLSLFMYVD